MRERADEVGVSASAFVSVSAFGCLLGSGMASSTLPAVEVWVSVQVIRKGEEGWERACVRLRTEPARGKEISRAPA